MDENTNGKAAPPTPDAPTTAAALQAFEQLTIQSQTPTKCESPSSRPSSSHMASGSVPRFDSPAQVNGLRRSSSSFAQPTNIPSPQVRKRLSTSSLKGAPSPSSPRFPNSRRSSSNFPIRPASQASFTSTFEDSPKPRTAATVGAEVFAKDLAAHDEAHKNAETVVIIHEACYGHRFSRPRTSKAALSTIVERPERITAAILGLSTAYVRLGSRHSGGAHPPNPEEGPLATPPFAIRRSSRTVGLLSDPVVAVHGKDWMDELQSMCLAAGARLAVDGKEVVRVKQVDKHGQPTKHLHEGDLYLCTESLDALQGAVGGVCDAVDAIFSESLTKRAFVAVRPPGHHCSSDYPSGFCWLNNVHVGIQYAAQTYGLTHAVILDFDLHHGDGSQDITWDRNEHSAGAPKTWPHHRKPLIGYYSLHDINSFPCEMGDKEKVQNASLCLDAHSQSIWNVHLEHWKNEADFYQLYDSKYSILFSKAREFLRRETKRIKAAPKGGKPRSAVFISAGFDASQWEGAGMQRHGVNVPTSFYERFTQDAISLAKDDLSGADGRVVSVLEGGYSNRALTSGVLSHISGLCPGSSLLPNVNHALDSTTIKSEVDAEVEQTKALRQNSGAWWSSEALTALEAYEPIETAAPKKVRTGFMPTFASPTESFSQKVVDPEKFYRSMSGTMRPLPELPLDLSLPEVNWIAASHALSKLLVPAHRTTTSCMPEELAAPRTKKQRQSMGSVAPIDPAPGGRQLRDRKKAADAHSDDDAAARKSAASRAGRRKTMADMQAEQPVEVVGKPKRASRRSSAASGMDLLIRDQEPTPVVPAIPAAYAQHSPVDSTPKHSANAKKGRKSPVKTAVAAAQPNPVNAPAQADGSVQASSMSQASSVSEVAPPSLTTESSTASFETAPSTTSDMDSLTSAVKRITLKVGTREEHDRRVKEQLDAEKAAKADARRKPRKLAANKTKKFEGEGAIIAPAPVSTAGSVATFRPAGVANGIVPSKPSTPSQDLSRPVSRSNATPMAAPIADAIARDVSNGQEAISAPDRADSIQNTTPKSVMDVSSIVNPIDAPPQPRPASTHISPDRTATAQTQPQHDSPLIPDSADTTPKAKPARGRLPVFSSTGAIPFGNGKAVQAAAPDTVMGLPTPGYSGGYLDVGDGFGLEHGNGVSRSMLGPDEGAVTPATDGGGEAMDVWEVPETPAKK